MIQTTEPVGIQPNQEPGADRMETARLRKLPDFVIIGTQKGGTTSLNFYLAGHPDVGEAFKKEVHFFDFNFGRGVDWYRAHFPLQDSAAVVGEASPSYLFYPEAAQRVRATLPQVKLIALLRNPVDRAYSHYQMNVKKGIEPLPFAEAVAQEPERLRGDQSYFKSENWRLYSYVSRGVYVDQLRPWVEMFPREQLRIFRSEDFFENPERVYHETLDYLGLPRWSLKRYKIRKSGSYSGMDLQVRRQLAEYFAPHNIRLYDLLGRDLEWEGDAA